MTGQGLLVIGLLVLYLWLRHERITARKKNLRESINMHTRMMVANLRSHSLNGTHSELASECMTLLANNVPDSLLTQTPGQLARLEREFKRLSDQLAAVTPPPAE